MKQKEHYMICTPESVEFLEKDQIFVFGSNLAGIHGAGAAKFAYERFGAQMGIGEGLCGQSYAIPTKDKHIQPLPLDTIAAHVRKFIAFAIENPSYEFLVTPIGCGLAGYSPEQIAPLFKQALYIKNIILPHPFWNIMNSLNHNYAFFEDIQLGDRVASINNNSLYIGIVVKKDYGKDTYNVTIDTGHYVFTIWSRYWRSLANRIKKIIG